MIKSTDLFLVMGRRGCGKSYLARQIQKIYPRKIILDTLMEYTDDEIVNNFEEFSNSLLIKKENNISEFTLIYQFHPENRVGAAEFDEIMRLCYYYGNIQIVIEEAQNFASVHNMPHWMKECLLKGRHQNISMLFTTQRPGELHKTIFSQCTHIYCGTIVDGNDTRYLSNILRQDAEKLVNLPERRFIYFGPQGVSEISNDI